MYYEVIYENGDHSVAFYESEEEAARAVEAAHERAKAGEPMVASVENAPSAVRVKKVLKYDRHPADYASEMTLSSDVAKSVVKDALEVATTEGVVDIRQLQAELNEAIYPMQVTSRHESNFKMKELGEFEGTWVE